MFQLWIFLRIVLPLNKLSLSGDSHWSFMQIWNELILAMLIMTEVVMKTLILVLIIYNDVSEFS